MLYICKDRMGWCYVWCWWRVQWVLHSPDKLQRWKPSTALHSGPLRLRWRNSCFCLIWVSSCAVADDLEVKALKMKMMKASFPQALKNNSEKQNVSKVENAHSCFKGNFISRMAARNDFYKEFKMWDTWKKLSKSSYSTAEIVWKLFQSWPSLASLPLQYLCAWTRLYLHADWRMQLKLKSLVKHFTVPDRHT